MINISAYKAIIAYNGTKFQGWQSQKNKLGISDIITEKLSNLFKCKIKIQGASRTDSGVHAYGQVAKIELPLIDKDTDYLKKIINDNLPKDILIRDLKKIETDFCLFSDVIDKTYYYHISTTKAHPLHSDYIYHYPFPFCKDTFKSLLSFFIGTHDFRSFCSGDYEEKSTIRTIYECEIVENTSLSNDPSILKIKIRGNGFLKYMIRRIIGACLVSASRGYDQNYLYNILNKKDPCNSLFKADANGLILHEIQYK